MTERFHRSRTNRVIGGVAGGLAEYWNIDPVVARVLFIIIAMMTGIGFFLYIILWIIIPEEPYAMPNFGTDQKTDHAGSSKPDSESDSGKESEKQNDFSSFEYKYNYGNNVNTKSNGGRVFGGIALIGLGLFFLAERIFPYFDFEDFLPLVLIGIGIVLIINSNRNKNNAI